MCVVGDIVIVVVDIDDIVVVVFYVGEVDYVFGYGYYWVIDFCVEVYVFVGGGIVVEWVGMGVEIGCYVVVVDWYV